MSAIIAQIDPTFGQFIRSDDKMVVQLKKALYGCVESAKLWYDLLSSTLSSDGYAPNPMDSCIFNKTVKGKQCTVVVYVDVYNSTGSKYDRSSRRYFKEKFQGTNRP